MYAPVDAKWFSHSLMDSILDFKKDGDAVDKEYMYVTTNSGQRRSCKTTVDWELIILWKNGT